MTREEAIAEMEAYIPRASDGTRIRTDSLALAIDRWITAFREPGEPEAKPPAWDGEAFERAITEAAFEELKRPGMIREQSQRIAHRARELAEKGMGGK